MASERSRRVSKCIDYKLLNDGEINFNEFKKVKTVKKVQVLPETYSVERIIRRKTSDKVGK